jgi:hypothetical protein
MDKQTIVIARYNEDIHWCLPFIDLVKVYNKGNNNLNYIPNNKIINCENLGREGGTYVKHIIDNYNNLSKFTIFLQGNPFDHINNDNNKKLQTFNSLLQTIAEKKNYKFKYISTWLIDVPVSHVDEYCHGFTTLRSLFPSYYLKAKFRKGYTYGSGALFVVHKDQILRHSKDFWISLYSHLQEVSPPSGYGLEKLWRLLLE